MTVSTQASTTEITITEIVDSTLSDDNTHARHFWRCHCLHIKTVALFAGLLSFALYITVNIFFLITFHLLAVYFTLVIGIIFYIIFVYGYHEHNRWMVFIYFFFLGVFVAVLAAMLSFSVAFLRDPKHAPLLYLHDEFRLDHHYNRTDFYEKNPATLRHDIILYKVMFALSCSSLLITSLCIPVVYKFFKYICDCNSHLATSSSHRSQHCNCNARHARHRVRHRDRRRNATTTDSVCAISYPPPCPPAYEVEPTVHTPPLQPRHKANLPRSMLTLPQYTDFRPEVYAEPPPYDEKLPIDGNE